MIVCDRCPSAIAHWVIYTRSGLLYFCAHCYHKHEPALAIAGHRAENLETAKAGWSWR